MIYLLAADEMAALSGGSGWLGAGLLGGVLAWLLFVHLPSKDKQLKEFMDAKDKHVEMMASRYQIALDVVITHCREEMGRHWSRFDINLDEPSSKGG